MEQEKVVERKEVFDFPVERVPSHVFVDGKSIKTDRDCIVRMDTKKIIGYVSAETIKRATMDGQEENIRRGYYKVVTHTELVTEAREAIRELNLIPKETSYMLHNGGRLFHQFDFPQEIIAPAPNDFINMRLTLVNSYDLSRPCGWELGGLRLVCTNGLVAFKKAFFEMKKHAGSFSMDYTINSLKQALNTFRNDMQNYYAKLADTTIVPSVGTLMIKDMVEKKQLPEKYGLAIEKVWEDPKNANMVIPETNAKGETIPNTYVKVMDDVSLDFGRNLWTLYNAFTLILTHYVVSIERRMVIHAYVQARLNKMMRGN
jgi:hypothetical protein